MKLTTITGTAKKEGIKVFKPCTRLVIRQTYNDAKLPMNLVKNPTIRVRLENSRTGQSTEIVPTMQLEILSEIASHSEGFTRKPVITKDGTQFVYNGETFYNVVLNADAAVNLSADKYLEIDIFDLLSNAGIFTEVYAIEGNELDEFICRYRKFNLSSGETQKTFSVGENEALFLPYEDLDEVQFYTKDGSTMPTFTAIELAACMDLSNDICCVSQKQFSRNTVLMHHEHESGEVHCGSCLGAIIDLSQYGSFEIRRSVSTKAYEFYMIDNKR